MARMKLAAAVRNEKLPVSVAKDGDSRIYAVDGAEANRPSTNRPATDGSGRRKRHAAHGDVAASAEADLGLQAARKDALFAKPKHLPGTDAIESA